MTPSLLPRSALLQGVLSGITVSIGYGIGVGVAKLWNFLELPLPSATTARVIRIVALVVLGGFLVYSMFNLVRWQNDLRRLMAMEIVNDRLYPVVVFVVATLVTAALVGLGRWLVRVVRAFMRGSTGASRAARAGSSVRPSRSCCCWGSRPACC